MADSPSSRTLEPGCGFFLIVGIVGVFFLWVLGALGDIEDAVRDQTKVLRHMEQTCAPVMDPKEVPREP